MSHPLDRPIASDLSYESFQLRRLRAQLGLEAMDLALVLAQLARELACQEDGVNAYPHMCRDGHEEIGHSSDSEVCPLCAVQYINRELYEALKLAREYINDHTATLDVGSDRYLIDAAIEEKDHNASLAAVDTARSASDSDAATARHTLGPWKLDAVFPNPDEDQHFEPRVAIVGHCVEFGADIRIADMADVPSKDSEEMANAHLIAAAPELLAALKAIDAHWSSGNFSREESLWLPMLDAIAKAEGRQS